MTLFPVSGNGAHGEFAEAFAVLVEQLARSFAAMHERLDGLGARLDQTLSVRLPDDRPGCQNRDGAAPADPAGDLARNVKSIAATLDTLTQRVQSMNIMQEAFASGRENLADRFNVLGETLVLVLDAVKRRSIVDDDVRRYRNEELKTDFLQPVFRSVIMVLDRWAREAGRIAEIREEIARGNQAVIVEALNWVQNARKLDKVDLRNMLAQFGVEPFRSQRGDMFDPARHQVLRTSDPPSELAGRIAAHCLPGYVRRSDGWVVAPERVHVFRQNEASE
jgi:molecular chaperone GrpE (heat shock protein)